MSEKSDIPEDIKKDLTLYAKENGIELSEVKKMFKEEYNSEYLQSYEPDERARQAAYVVRAELSADFGGNVVYDGVIFQTTPTQTKDKKDDPTKEYTFSDIFGMFKSGNEKNAKFQPIKIRCFNDAVAGVNGLPLNTPIKINVSESEYNGNLNLSISGDIKYTIIEKASKGFNLRDFVEGNIGKAIRIEEVPFKYSENDDDKRVIKGRVKGRSIKTSKKGNLLAKYIIYDDERGPDSVMFISTMLTDQLWDKGALIWAVGTNKEPEAQYKDSKSQSMFADFVVGIIPKKVQPDKFKAMLSNAKKELEAKGTDTPPAPVEVPDAPDISGLQEVMQKEDAPENVDFSEWD